MTIQIKELLNRGAKLHSISCRAEFIQTVDAIRKRRNQNNGWQLLLDGEISDEQSAFGSTVCFGVNSPSFFNDSKCPICLEPLSNLNGDMNPKTEIHNKFIGRVHIECILLDAVNNLTKSN